MNDVTQENMRKTVIDAIANESRLKILCALTQGEHSVSELDKLLPITRPNISKHLAVLRVKDIVKLRLEGRKSFYSLASDDIHKILNELQ